MKLKISELNPNPFKKKLGSELDEDTIEKLQANLDELGMMGALPVVQIGKRYHLVFGHHRIEAFKREFGNGYQIEVELHKYNEDQLLRGMVVENLTQSSHPFKSEMGHLKVVREYLREIEFCPLSGQNPQGGRPNEPGSIRDISRWLDKETGTVMKKSKISDILKIADNLDEEILKDVEKQSHATGEKKDDSVGVKIASYLASIENKQEQKLLRKAIRNSRESHQDIICTSITTYKNAPSEIKQQVLDGYIDIADIEDAITISKPKESDSTTFFIPNFSSQIKQFNNDVAKLEQQVALFSKVFGDKQFKIKYSSLKPKQKQILDDTIGAIKNRIKNCYNEIESFESKLLGEKNLVEVA